MGVDYTAHYGIGYEVEAGDSISEDDLEDGLLNLRGFYEQKNA